MNIEEAGDGRRIANTEPSEPTGERMSDGGIIQLESGFPHESIRELMKMGHTIQFDLTGYGYQGIRYDWVNKVYYGASDSRKVGQAAGYQVKIRNFL